MENNSLSSTREALVETIQRQLGMYCIGTPEYEKQKKEFLSLFTNESKKGGKKINRTVRKKRNVRGRTTSKK